MRPGSTLTVQMLSHGQDPDQEVMSLLAPLVVEVNALVSADRSYLLALTAGSRIDRFGRFRLHGRAGFPFRVSRSQHRRRASCLFSCVKPPRLVCNRAAGLQPGHIYSTSSPTSNATRCTRRASSSSCARTRHWIKTRHESYENLYSPRFISSQDPASRSSYFETGRT